MNLSVIEDAEIDRVNNLINIKKAESVLYKNYIEATFCNKASNEYIAFEKKFTKNISKKSFDIMKFSTSTDSHIVQHLDDEDKCNIVAEVFNKIGGAKGTFYCDYYNVSFHDKKRNVLKYNKSFF